MKNTNVEWIGHIPEHWNLIRFKDIYLNKKDIAGASAVDYERLALTLNGVIKRLKDDSEGLQPEAFDGYQIIHENDFIFKMIDLQNISTSRVGLSPYTGLVSPAYIRFSPRQENQYNKFVYYFLMSMYHNCVYNNLGGNGVRSALNATDMGQFKIPYPSIETQKKIVEFLESKFQAVDELIANQQAQIEKLKEYKQSIITEAVTKGLDKSAPMKDSGIEWIGEIPAKWNMKKLKNITTLVTDGTHVTPNYIDEGVPFLSIKDVSSGKICFSDTKFISQQDHVLLSKSTPVEKGDLLFTRIGTMGIFVFVDTDITFDIFVSLGLIKFDKTVSLLNKKYIRYFLSSLCMMNYINLVKAGGGTTAAKFNLGDVKNTTIIYPSNEDQTRIVNYLDERCERIDRLMEVIQQKIEKLQEYKKSLIYEYVTGKKEVV